MQIQGSAVDISDITQTRSAQHDAKCGCAGRERRVKLAGVVRCGLRGHQHDGRRLVYLNGVTAVIIFLYLIGFHNGYAVCKAVGQCSISLYGNGVCLPLRHTVGHIQRFIAVFRKTTIYTHLEGSAILIAHRGKGNVAAFRQSGLGHKVAAGDGKIVRADGAYSRSVGKQAAADAKHAGVTFCGRNLSVKQAVGDGGVVRIELYTLFKGSTLNCGPFGGLVHLDNFLKGAAGDGSEVSHLPLEDAAEDGFGVVHRLLEGTVGDGAVVIHIRLEGAAGDGSVVVHLPLEGTVGDGSEVSHLPLEDAVEDGAVIVGFTADGAAD